MVGELRIWGEVISLWVPDDLAAPLTLVLGPENPVRCRPWTLASVGRGGFRIALDNFLRPYAGSENL